MPPITDPLAPPDCGGRFTYHSFLGAGGMGAVYEAYDHQRQSLVAIKVMRRVSGAWIYRFKGEFRSLAGIVHPNLVSLHELIEWEGRWLFTMELVPGEPFSIARTTDLGTTSTQVDPAADQPASDGPRRLAVPRRRSDETSPLPTDVFGISDALCQLCEGLDYLHRRGTAHGDVKPANVLITPDGRVVILDFGIARDVRSEAEEDDGLSLLGTPGYLAPERVRGDPVTPAADMYAVGVTLFEVLTGQRLDTEPEPEAVLRRTRQADSAGARRDLLVQLCLRLLCPDPAQRPTAAEVRDAVVAEGVRTGREQVIQLVLQLVRSGDETPFVARAAEVEAIRNAVLAERTDAPRFVIVSGESGIGKTGLLRRVLDEGLLASCLVLEGKCYEREQVPYRALDRVIDALSAKLLGVDAEELQALSWLDLAVVARMFPVLRRVPEIERVCQKELRADERDPPERRRAAAATLGQLLEIVAEGRRVVLYVDDLHWGDEESAIVLRDLLLGAKSLDLRVVACHRHPVAGSAVVSRLVDGDPKLSHAEISVGPLPAGESESLARSLLGPSASASHVARVASEAGGNPFLICELTRFAAGVDLDQLALRSAVARHVALLSEQARRVLEVLAVAGRRLDVALARRAADVGHAFEPALILLRNQHLIKAADTLGREIEPYHDRIREVIAAGLSPASLAARHLDLARALEEMGDPEPSLLGFHLEGAGESERAAELLLQAAHNAEASLAPLNAADLYERVARLVPEQDPRHRAARHGYAWNLDVAGRGTHAAPIYMELAEEAEPVEALGLRRRAARAWSAAGEFDKAAATLDSVLAGAGVSLPRSRLGFAVRLARDRLWLRLRKNRYVMRNEYDIPIEELLRVDAFEIASQILVATSLTGAYLAHTARLRESLCVGEPKRIARAFVDEVLMASIGGEKASRHGLELLRVAREAIETGNFSEERALVQNVTGVHALYNGRYQRVVDVLEKLVDGPELRRTGLPLRTGRSVVLTSRFWLGSWREMATESARWVVESRERGDEYAALLFLGEVHGQWAAVLDDEPERAIRNATATLESPLLAKLAFPRLAVGQTCAWASLYMGRADEAARALEFRGNVATFLRVQRTAVELQVLRAYAALLRGKPGHSTAEKWLEKIEKRGLAWAEPVARIIRASLAAGEGRADESLVDLDVAVSLCEREGYRMFGAAASWRLGQLQGGDEGAARRAAAEARIADEGAKRPDRIVRALAPGFGDVV
jgi:eukaryotic-like serine/threonine-protein kinase